MKRADARRLMDAASTLLAYAEGRDVDEALTEIPIARSYVARLRAAFEACEAEEVEAANG